MGKYFKWENEVHLPSVNPYKQAMEKEALIKTT